MTETMVQRLEEKKSGKEMREKGSLKQILDKYESPPQVCPDYNGKPLGFEDFKPQDRINRSPASAGLGGGGDLGRINSESRGQPRPDLGATRPCACKAQRGSMRHHRHPTDP